jgi:hypothetical protein
LPRNFHQDAKKNEFGRLFYLFPDYDSTGEPNYGNTASFLAAASGKFDLLVHI